ncbi:MAG: thioredoxin domain-containing protein [Altererythrobacter sp.]|nr:thioredoxin domain-containing protein [Altererythrobacter sp.]
MQRFFFTALIALVFGFVGAGLWSLSGLGEPRMRAWLVANPDVLPEMASALERREGQARLAEVGEEVARPFPGAVLGNPAGKRTLVKFTDYGCSFCRSSEADVQRLVASDPELRIVVREWPIFKGSEEAARMALAAAEQGRYAAFYTAMFAGDPPSPASVARAAAKAGLDMERARRVAASNAVAAELASTMQLARTLRFTGTPSWVAGGQVLEGAVGYERLKAALDGTEAG